MNLSKFNRGNIDSLLFGTINLLAQIFAVVWIIVNFSVPLLIGYIVVSLLFGSLPMIFVHRAWSHKGWTPNYYLNLVGLFIHTISLRSTSLAWVAVHREHHKHTDTPQDPHSPYIKRWLAVQFGHLNISTTSFVRNTIDLIRQPEHIWFAKYYWYINILFYGCLYLIDPFVLYCFIAYTGLGLMQTRMVNSLLHNSPWWISLDAHKHRGAANSYSFNLLWIGSGEAWHANHHNDPGNWKLGNKWYQFDTGTLMIRLFVILGLATVKN